MTPLLAVLDLSGYALIAAMVAVFAGGAALTKRQGIDPGRLERRLKSVEQKLDALLKHEGIEPPPPPASGLSPEVERLARDPSKKIAAIKLYREENPGVGLAEAKAKIEEFAEGGR
jgi:ribosomal protein L7/L12